MKTIALLLAFSLGVCAQSTHIIRIITAGGTTGEIDFCGDSSHLTACVTEKPNTLGTVLTVTGSKTITGNLVVGSSDNAYLAVDASGSLRAGMTKKSGVIPRFTYGSGINFEVAQSNATDIGSGNTFTTHFSLDASTSAPTFTFNSPTTGAVFTQSGAAPAINANTSNASAVISVANASSGDGVSGSSSSGRGVFGVSSSFTGVGGQSGTGDAVGGLATGVGGIGVSASCAGLFCEGLHVTNVGSGLAAHFAIGMVQIDGSLTLAGSFSGTHAQNVGAGDIVGFALVDSTTGFTSTSGGVGVGGNISTGGTLSVASTSVFGSGTTVTIGASGTISAGASVAAGTNILSLGYTQANGGFRDGSAVGVTSSTCSHWTGGICDTI